MSLETICNIIKKEYANANESQTSSEDFINNLVSNLVSNLINDLSNDYKLEKIIYCLKYLFDINIELNIESDIKPKYKSIIARNDNEYRKAVKDKFKKCIICDDCPEYTYQVAHIWNHKDCKNNHEDAFNVNNGLLMCANAHLLFDNHILKLQASNELDSANEYKCIVVINKDKANEYYKYNNKTIFLNYENVKYLEKRYSNTDNIMGNNL